MSNERVLQSIAAIVERTTESDVVVTGERTLRAELSNVPTNTLQKVMEEHGEDVRMLTLQAGERHDEPYLMVKVGSIPPVKERMRRGNGV